MVSKDESLEKIVVPKRLQQALAERLEFPHGKQGAVADAAGISYKTIWNWRGGSLDVNVTEWTENHCTAIARTRLYE